MMGLYDNYIESKSHHEKERLQGDVSSYDFFEIQDDVNKFYYTVNENNDQNPVSGLRICERGCVTVLSPLVTEGMTMKMTDIVEILVTSCFPTKL